MLFRSCHKLSKQASRSFSNRTEKGDKIVKENWRKNSSKQCCVYGVHFLLGPNVNILRDPRNGRLFEGYSEDPCVVSKLAPEIVKGIQSYGVSATVKHYAANSQETNRVGIDETISKRALEEIYFPGFRACVKEGGTKSIMNAYNRINGVRCTESAWLLEEKLRKDFGFDGMVMSD